MRLTQTNTYDYTSCELVLYCIPSSALSNIGSLNIDVSTFGKSASPAAVQANVSAPTSLELLETRRQVC